MGQSLTTPYSPMGQSLTTPYSPMGQSQTTPYSPMGQSLTTPYSPMEWTTIDQILIPPASHRFVIQLCVFFECGAEWVDPLTVTHRVLLRSEHVEVMRNGYGHLIQRLPQPTTQQPGTHRLGGGHRTYTHTHTHTHTHDNWSDSLKLRLLELMEYSPH